MVKIWYSLENNVDLTLGVDTDAHKLKQTSFKTLYLNLENR